MTPPLSEKQQHAWDVHKTMSIRDVARVMGISIDAVNGHLKRARQKRARAHEMSSGAGNQCNVANLTNLPSLM